MHNGGQEPDSGIPELAFVNEDAYVAKADAERFAGVRKLQRAADAVAAENVKPGGTFGKGIAFSSQEIQRMSDYCSRHRNAGAAERLAQLHAEMQRFAERKRFEAEACLQAVGGDDVTVVDSVMGTGKTEAAIRCMLTCAGMDRRFLYITPYLDEVSRVADACRSMSFSVPSDRYSSKSSDIRRLVHIGANVASTHALLKWFTPDMIQDIRDRHYWLFLDEDFEVVRVLGIRPGYFKLLCSAGIFSVEEDGKVSWTAHDEDIDEPTGMEDLKRMALQGGMRFCRDTNTVVWEFPVGILKAFEKIVILTYKFSGSDMRRYFDRHGIRYTLAGVRPGADGFEFVSERAAPDWLCRIPELVTVVGSAAFPDPDGSPMEDTRFSKNWYEHANSDDIGKLRGEICEVFRKYGGRRRDRCLYTTFAGHSRLMQGTPWGEPGVSFVACNMKATNRYIGKTVLAYCVNVFPNPDMDAVFGDRGNADSDAYALASMMQWIWRSAIRNGKPVVVYVPSARMRCLLLRQLEQFRNGEM